MQEISGNPAIDAEKLAAENITPFVGSADPEDRAGGTVKAECWTFPGPIAMDRMVRSAVLVSSSRMP
ncbi:hypothetical protein OAH97_01960 [Octadecabacter sp.]|nr:hypothetical protein [Octadecabacter sp.]